MRPLTYDLMQLCRRNKDGSEGTRAERRKTLRLISDQLAALGYKKMRAHELKGRHINKLLALWESQNLSVGTRKNRLAVLRWWSDKIGNPGVMSRDNAQYGLPKRSFAQASRARDLSDDVLDRIDGPYADRIRYSLRLQRLFGLRREESLKFTPSFAIRRDAAGVITAVHLKASWTKGGRPRRVEVRTAPQRALLEEVAQLAGKVSLIAPGMSYVQYLQQFEYRTRKAGLDRKHGLRHQYAQDRYKELTGWDCPLAGGGVLTPGQAERDRDVRDQIAVELGHERRSVTNAYLGRVRRARDGSSDGEMDAVASADNGGPVGGEPRAGPQPDGCGGNVHRHEALEASCRGDRSTAD